MYKVYKSLVALENTEHTENHINNILEKVYSQVHLNEIKFFKRRKKTWPLMTSNTYMLYI